MANIFDLTSDDCLGAFAVFIACFLASAGGIGGGGVIVSVFLTVYNFSYDRSVILSFVTVMGNLTSQLVQNFKKRHPFKKSRPLVYYDAVLILIPAQLGGSSIGKIVAKLVPETAKKCFALTVLTLVTVKTFIKARGFYIKETELKLKDALLIMDSVDQQDSERKKAEQIVTTVSSPMLDLDKTMLDLDSNDLHRNLLDDSYDSERNVIVGEVSFHSPGLVMGELDERADGNHTSSGGYLHRNSDDHVRYNSQGTKIEGVTNDIFNPDDETILDNVVVGKKQYIPRVYPWNTILAIFLIWLLYGGVFIIGSYTETCTFLYWLVVALALPPLLVCTIWGLRTVKAMQIELGSAYVLPGDIDVRSISCLPPMLSFSIGIMCNLLGIGGGELMGPLLLWMKCDPQVTSATTSVMSLIGSSSNVIHYGVDNEIPFSIAPWMFMFGLIGGFLGRMFAIKVIKGFGRPSITAFALSGTLFVSSMLILYDLTTSDVDMEVGSACD